MTGRGKDATMYGRDAFIDEVRTLDGGIDYAYYHYMRWHLLRNEIGDFPLAEEHRSRIDGLGNLWAVEQDTLDTYRNATGRHENSMWHFCNNHDQWRMQAIDEASGGALLRVCLFWLSFWTGVPLHYAGDEQGFKTCKPAPFSAPWGALAPAIALTARPHGARQTARHSMGGRVKSLPPRSPGARSARCRRATRST